MRILADTHVAIWYAITPQRLSATALACLNDSNNDIFVSMATAWEMAIKCGLGKLTIPMRSDAFVHELERQSEWQVLAINLQHTAEVESLPSHHRGPFDRMLIAQAITEGLKIVSVDSAFDAYGVGRIW
jgi:PIN domain nuclease of toxin-antitoxin system